MLTPTTALSSAPRRGVSRHPKRGWGPWQWGASLPGTGASPDLRPGRVSLAPAERYRGEPLVLRKCRFLLLPVRVELNHPSWQGNWSEASFPTSDLRSKASALPAAPCSYKEQCWESDAGGTQMARPPRRPPALAGQPGTAGSSNTCYGSRCCRRAERRRTSRRRGGKGREEGQKTPYQDVLCTDVKNREHLY